MCPSYSVYAAVQLIIHIKSDYLSNEKQKPYRNIPMLLVKYLLARPKRSFIIHSWMIVLFTATEAATAAHCNSHSYSKKTFTFFFLHVHALIN